MTSQHSQHPFSLFPVLVLMFNSLSDEFIREKLFYSFSKQRALRWQMMWDRFAVTPDFSQLLFIVRIQKGGNIPETGNSRLVMVEMWNVNHQRDDSWKSVAAKCKKRLCYIRVDVLVDVFVCVYAYLLHRCIASNQLLPQVSDVMVKPLHVLLKVLPEGQKRLLHFTLELLKQKTTNSSTLTTRGEHFTFEWIQLQNYSRRPGFQTPEMRCNILWGLLEWRTSLALVSIFSQELYSTSLLLYYITITLLLLIIIIIYIQ